FRDLMKLLVRISALHCKTDIGQTFRVRRDEMMRDSMLVERLRGARRFPGLQTSNAFGKRLLERAANRHHLADRLHLRTQDGLSTRELLELPARNFDYDIVEYRFKGGGRDLGDVILDLVEPITDRQLGSNLRDRESGGLRRQ